MPELPEVETIARDLRNTLVGQEVVELRLINKAIVENKNRYNPVELVGKKLIEIRRLGKNLIFRFESGKAIICHLKMTGRLIIDAPETDQNKHLHFWIKFNKNKLSFFDIRKFGRICFVVDDDLMKHPRLSRLGPEPFDLTADEFAQKIKKRAKPIKLTLIDQEIIAGIGNIYADESLFNAGIRPMRKSSSLSLNKLRQLHAAIKKVLTQAIANRGSSIDDYLDGRGRKGNFQNLIKVYGKTGQKCPNCDSQIRRIVLGGRSTHYCPLCQK